MEETRKRDADATKAAILEAAEALFMEKGFADVSLSQLAKAAGVTKSLIHHHFGSKDQLWVDVKLNFFKDYFDEYVEMLTTQEASVDLLYKSVEGYFRYLQAKPEFVRMSCWMLLEQDESCAEMDLRIIEIGIERIKESQAKGDIRADIPADYIVISFLTLVEGWFLGKHRWRRSHFKDMAEEEREAALSDDSYLINMLKIFFDGVRPR
ncbi:MAG: TetR/AcrR family transcriptional regulator [Acidobacteriota bacterium]|nr:TetR/AcrR family transcriptional regulator [Acidobacteriota bacterium]